ncbi:hypothetical protein LOAG_15578 [Loa loa]|uniref:Uncharacterized protein n=1 Tax=Loa loa TaxID=7209 RepID=A0A1S0TFZ3_LOALO|nr:hypothetical protein LOAG_15578 [Loa loa]EFO12953.1 hypothetical protein LOAG_15578 [Loa loa]
MQDVRDNNGEKNEKPTIQLAVSGTQNTKLSEECDADKPKFKEVDLNDNKNLKKMDLIDNKNPKQNEINQQLAKSFIAEFTQKSTSKSGKEPSACKNGSVIRDNTLEEIPRDMPKYDSL